MIYLCNLETVNECFCAVIGLRSTMCAIFGKSRDGSSSPLESHLEHKTANLEILSNNILY